MSSVSAWPSLGLAAAKPARMRSADSGGGVREVAAHSMLSARLTRAMRPSRGGGWLLTGAASTRANSVGGDQCGIDGGTRGV